MAQCAACKVPTCPVSCPVCRVVGYCSERCQQAHWDDHKSACNNGRAPRAEAKPPLKASPKPRIDKGALQAALQDRTNLSWKQRESERGKRTLGCAL